MISNDASIFFYLQASRKVSKCGYLFVAPDWDFNNPLYRTKVSSFCFCQLEILILMCEPTTPIEPFRNTNKMIGWMTSVAAAQVHRQTRRQEKEKKKQKKKKKKNGTLPIGNQSRAKLWHALHLLSLPFSVFTKFDVKNSINNSELYMYIWNGYRHWAAFIYDILYLRAILVVSVHNLCLSLSFAPWTYWRFPFTGRNVFFFFGWTADCVVRSSTR